MKYDPVKDQFISNWTLAKGPAGSVTITVTVSYIGTTTTTTATQQITITK